MKIAWLGTASLLIECDGVRLLIDPYLRLHNPSLQPFPMEMIENVDAVFISHPHFDHFADVPVVMEHCRAPFYVCGRGMEIAREQGFDMERLRCIAPGDVIPFGKLKVQAWQSCHCEYDRPVMRETLSRALKPSNVREGLSLEHLNHTFRIDMHRDVLAYEVISEQKRVFVLGSANCCDDIEYPSHMDLLVYPFQGRSNMETYSMQFLDRFLPERLMLDHFDDAFPPISAQMDCAPFAMDVHLCYPDMEVIVPKERTAYEV